MSTTLLGFANLTSLASLDPTDYLGDGTNQTIPADTRAIVFNYSGKMVFYSLEEAAGHSTSGYEEVVPLNNPGDYYWKCRGITKDVGFTAPSGASFTIRNGSFYPPTGFTGGVLSYEELSLGPLGTDLYNVSTDNGDYSFYGYGYYNNQIYMVDVNYLVKHNIITDEYIVDETIPIPITFWWSTSIDLTSTDGSQEILSEIEDFSNGDFVHLFDLKNETYSFKALNIPASDTLLDVFGASVAYAVPLRMGKYHHLFSGSVQYASDAHIRIDITTGDVEILDTLTAASNGGIAVPDYENNCFYFIERSAASRMYRYDITGDSWNTLAVHSVGASVTYNSLAYLDQNTRTIIWPESADDLYIYDITLDVWETITANWNDNLYWTSYPLVIPDVGGVAPWGWGNGGSSSMDHAVILENNPTIFTKD